ncbi:DUF4350 domain-containing protein [Actinoplanes sp. GCM10030250]
MRVVLPFLVLLALVGGTLVVHAVEQPDLGDPAYLSPVSSADIGSSSLAAMLAQRGVEVDRRTSTEAVLAALDGTPATVFVPAPSYAYLSTLTSSTSVPPGTRLVLVAPDGDILEARGWPGSVRRTRWAAAATDPACAGPVAGAEGRAAVLRRQYATESGTLCYDGGVLRFDRDGYDVTLAGAADPFRNDRIGEHDNAALAVGLLSQDPRVIWLDLHERERPPPEPTFTPEPEFSAEPDPSADNYFPDENGEPGDPGQPGEPGRPIPNEGSDPSGSSGSSGQGESLQDSALAQAFPAPFWATVLLVLLVAIAFAVAAARRLGTPVTEPLPSRVPAHETMLGHGRLYARARARGQSLEILRDAARHRITEHLGLPADATAERIAASAGMPAEYVRAVLEGDPPESDEDLVTAARFLRDLEHDITRSPFEGETP